MREGSLQSLDTPLPLNQVLLTRATMPVMERQKSEIPSPAYIRLFGVATMNWPMVMDPVARPAYPETTRRPAMSPLTLTIWKIIVN